MSTTASADASADINRHNPFVNRGDADGITCSLILVMLTINRINHINLALQQARGLRKLLSKVKSVSASDEELVDRLRKEISSLGDVLAATLTNKRQYAHQLNQGLFELDPRFLLFEFCHGLVLRPSQVVLVNKLLDDMEHGRSVCHQMIMGAGKTTVVGPLLAMVLANAKTLVFEVVPPALLDFSAGILRERFSAIVRKPVFTFTFDRYTMASDELLSKLLTARNLRAVIVSTPSSVKSFMLKFLEICHNLSRQKNIQLEKKERRAIATVFNFNSVRHMLGLGTKTATSGEMTAKEIHMARYQAVLCHRIFNIMREGIEIMDEVDIILHPLKSELNWPLGIKEPLDFTRSRMGNGLRWGIPSHLLDAIFCCCGMPVLADIADSRASSE